MIDKDLSKSKIKQLKSILHIIEKCSKKLAHIEIFYKNNNEDEENKEKYNARDNVIQNYLEILKRYKITDVNMYSLIYRVFTKDNKYRLKCKFKLDLLNMLYKNNREVFINAFKTH